MSFEEPCPTFQLCSELRHAGGGAEGLGQTHHGAAGEQQPQPRALRLPTEMGKSEKSVRRRWWLWVKNRYPVWNLGKWQRRLKSASWWF